MERRERRQLLEKLQADGLRIARQFGLEVRDIRADHPRAKTRYGLCYRDGVIKIRLNHVRTGRPLKYSSLVCTLCHELAHLKHFDHSPAFHRFYLRLLGWARERAIYRPGQVHGAPRSRTSPPVASPSRAPTEPGTAPEASLLVGPTRAPGYLGPARRNGVPVFGPTTPRVQSPDSPRRTLWLPWDAPAIPGPPVDGPRPRPRVETRPAPAAPTPRRPEPVQLSLF